MKKTTISYKPRQPKLSTEVNANAVVIPLGKSPHFQTRMEQLLEDEDNAKKLLAQARENVKVYADFLRKEIAKVK